MRSKGRALACAWAVLVLLVGCGGAPSGTLGDPFPTAGQPTATQPGAGGQLPHSGALARVVNLFADDDGPAALDVYGYGGSDLVANGVRVATVAHGQASDWFDPGYIDSSGGGRTAQVDVRRAGAQEPLAGYGDATVTEGMRVTILVLPSGTFGVPTLGIYEHHPEREDNPPALTDRALLLTNQGGLADEELQAGFYYASVGDGCLPGVHVDEVMGPLPQPISQPLTVPPGSHQLAIHGSPPLGEMATCDDAPLATTTLDVEAGDQLHVLLYSLPGSDQIEVLVLPLGE